MRIAALALLLVSARAEGQVASGARVASVGFMAIGVVTRASPAYLGRVFTEGYVTQPNVMSDLRWGPLQGFATLNFEGYTLRRGQLNAGMYGEGYVDRRHPHTFVHEAMVSAATDTTRRIRASLSVGKGFTPYGTDDPMMRTLITYPVNHHHAQIIERVQAIAALRVGSAGRGLTVEHGRFNGDEPYAPFSAPRWSRFGDSRASRITLFPLRGVEVQSSRAFVQSPGIIQGGAFDHVQQSTSLRVERANQRGDARVLLAEFARTDEAANGQRAFRFESLLAEGMMEHRGWRLALRAERTERPENERLLDPFRIANGHIDFQIIGVTRWHIATMQISTPALAFARLGAARVAPFVEVSRAHAAARRFPTVFAPADFYGRATQLSVSAGGRLHIGAMRHRMGRYGVLAPATVPSTMRHAAHQSMSHAMPDE